MAVVARLQKAWTAFKGTKAFRPTYLVGLGALIAILMPYLAGPAACLAFLLMPATMFVFPYWFGERRTRRFLVNGAVVFVIGVLLTAALYAFAIGAPPTPQLSSENIAGSDLSMRLSNGTVEPVTGSPLSTFTFRVTLTTTNDSLPSNYTVRLELLAYVGPLRTTDSFNMAPYAGQTNTRLGAVYEFNHTLGSDVYVFGFSAQSVLETTRWSFTSGTVAPIVAGWPAYYAFYLFVFASWLVPLLLFYYFFVFMWWYSARMKQSRRRMLERAELGKAPEPTKIAKSSSAATRKASAFSCTACGADVEEMDAKCPKCGAVFED